MTASELVDFLTLRGLCADPTTGAGIARRLAGLEDLVARLEGRIRVLELGAGDAPAPPIDRLENHLQRDTQVRAAELDDQERTP